MNELIPIAHNNQRVLTTKQLSDVYETDVANIKNNFKRNSKHFVEGIHYYLLRGHDLRSFKNLVTDSYLVDKHVPHLTLWTERGANRHCKILDTEKAWEQFDFLEETYFRVKDMVRKQAEAVPTYPELLRRHADTLEENERLKEREKALLPQAQGYQLVVKSNNAQNMNAFAKSMNWGRNRLYDFLREQKIFMPNTAIPYQRFCEDGYFKVKYTARDGRTFPFTLVTPKGMDYIIRKVQECGVIHDLLNSKEVAVC